MTARRPLDVRNFGPPALVPIGDVLDPLWNTLRAINGVASAASTRVRVHCTVEGGSGVVRTPPPGADGGPDGLDGDPAS